MSKQELAALLLEEYLEAEVWCRVGDLHVARSAVGSVASRLGVYTEYQALLREAKKR